jgi:hypothetical protein
MAARQLTPALPVRIGDQIDPVWRAWGTYLSERQWGTVREDYSPDGNAWDSFPHDHARSRAYRWGEDGLLGLCDHEALLCFSFAFWNEQDAILKERLFGLTGNQGNHGEDVKEVYHFLDNTPTHSYMKALYRYPQSRYPYEELVRENRARDRTQPPYNLPDTGIFADQRFFDITIEYAKIDPRDIAIKVTASNRGPDPAPLHLLPQLWFRNTWSWGRNPRRPEIVSAPGASGHPHLHARHHRLGEMWLACEGDSDLLFTENESNAERLWGVPNATPFVKDAFHRAIVNGDKAAVNPDQRGTKAAFHLHGTVEPGASMSLLLRLSHTQHAEPFHELDSVCTGRKQEADRFYEASAGDLLTDDEERVRRQAFSGLLWSKQVYHYDVMQWIDGDPATPAPPSERRDGRNSQWRHLNNGDVISMPDTWEYPWYAAWDLAFHCISLALIDPGFAKEQLLLVLREWYMHPNGQLPAYEWALGDVNPPVHAWAAWRVYKIEKRFTGTGDHAFLERIFHKLLLNFTWWVNRKDSEGKNVFQGGFLGLDNIGVFDRSKELPTGGYLEQSDATAWMGMYCLNMLAIALELARANPAYEDVATKFLEHFMYIAGAMNGLGLDAERSADLWDDEDGFFYDVLHLPDGTAQRLKVRSLVGLIPLLAIETIEPNIAHQLPDFSRRFRWFLTNRPDLAALVPSWSAEGMGKRRMLALVHGDRLRALLRHMLDPHEMLSDHGVRSLSKHHLAHPYQFPGIDAVAPVTYEPAESTGGLFGGNSNWRGPVWFPINFLMIEALERYHHYYGDEFLVEHPTGSGRMRTLRQIRNDLAERLIGLFLPGEQGRRPADGLGRNDVDYPHLLFHEYFDGDSGRGLGAAHQTGWTALVAKLLDTRSRAGGRQAEREETSLS